MNRTYVMFDLEWNCSKRPARHLPNEIIEIGAVKFNDKLQIIDTFSLLVKPRIYRVLHPKVQRLTKLCINDLRGGVPLLTAIQLFRNWISEPQFILCSWGKSDIDVLKENCLFYNPDCKFKWLKKYIDLQEYFSIGRNQDSIGLKRAAQELNIAVNDYLLHSALGDAQLLSEIFLSTFDPEHIKYHIRNVSGSQRNFTPLSRSTILNRSDRRLNRRKFIFNCPDCGKFMAQYHPWSIVNERFATFCKCSSCNAIAECHLKATVTHKDNHVSYQKKIRLISSNENLAAKQPLKNSDSKQFSLVASSSTNALLLPLQDLLSKTTLQNLISL